MKVENNILILLGPPGSGKGSLSRLCVKRLGWAQLSTGNLCRQHINERTEIGQKIDFILKSGKLISDELIIKMVEDWLISQFNTSKSVILDGFPRTIAQAEALNGMLKSTHFDAVRLKIVKMNIAESQIIERLSSRSVCQNNKCQAVYTLQNNCSLSPKNQMVCDECSSPLVRRADDEETAIRERLLIYHDHEQNLINFYTEIGLNIAHLMVHRPIEDVYEEFLTTIGLRSA